MPPSPACPVCGKTLPPGAPQGLCPACLLQAGVPTGSPAPSRPHQPFVPPTQSELAPHFPQLEILELIGQGGMGAVYRARQPSLDRHVALKILRPQAEADPGFAERFTREARALARLNHPNIVGVHDFGQAGGYHYLLMEFVDGMNLRQLLNSQKIAPREALAIIPPICDALQYAHDQGIVHRDIKPENILIGKNGAVKIADFGLAKLIGAEASGFTLTRDREVMGTPHYMAPEQVERPLEVDHRADIFSLGVVLYQMLTGELPLGRFAAPSRKVQIDVRLDEVVLRALEKEPEQRYQQVTAFKTDVETIHAGGEQPAAGATTAAPALRLTIARRWGPRFVIVAITALVGLGLGFPVAIFARAIAFFSVDPVGESLRVVVAAIMTLAAGYFLYRIWRSYLSGTAAPPIARRAWIGSVAGLAVMLALLLMHRPPAPPPRVYRSSNPTVMLRGELRNLTPAVLSHPLLQRFVIFQGWLFELPETMSFSPIDLAAAQNGRLDDVSSQMLFPATSTQTNASMATNVPLTPRLRGELSVTPRTASRGFDYTITMQLVDVLQSGPANSNSAKQLTRRLVTAEGSIAAREPLIVELGSFRPGRRHIAVFWFQRWSNDVFSNPSVLQPILRTEPPATIAAKATSAPSQAQPASPAKRPDDVQPNFSSDGMRVPLTPRETPPPTSPAAARKNLPAYADYDAMEGDSEILKVMLRTANADRQLIKARFDAGLAGVDELHAVESQQSQLEARLKGDRVAFATAAMTSAQKQATLLRARRSAGVATDIDLQAAESALQIAEIRLRREREREAARTIAPSTGTPARISGATLSAYPEYEAMESDPDILMELIRQTLAEYNLQHARRQAGLASQEDLDALLLKRGLLEARLEGARWKFAGYQYGFATKKLNAVKSRHDAGLATTTDVGAASAAVEVAAIRVSREGGQLMRSNSMPEEPPGGVVARLAADSRTQTVVMTIHNVLPATRRIAEAQRGNLEVDGVRFSRPVGNSVKSTPLEPGRSLTEVIALTSDWRDAAGQPLQLPPGRHTIRVFTSVEDNLTNPLSVTTNAVTLDVPVVGPALDAPAPAGPGSKL